MAQNSMEAKTNKNSVWKIIFIIMSILVLLIAGVILGRTVFSDGIEEDNSVGFFGNGENDPVETQIELEQFLVNISGDSYNSNSILRMDLTLSSNYEDAEEIMSENIPKIRDAVIHVVSTHSPETIFEKNETEHFLIKEELKTRINESLDEEVIKEVFITDIIMQN